MKHPMTAIIALAFGTALVTAATAQTTNSAMQPSTPAQNAQTGSTAGAGTGMQMSSDMQAQQPGMSQPSKKTRHAATKQTRKVHTASAPIVHKRLAVIHMKPRNQRPHLAAQRINGSSQQRTTGYGSSMPKGNAPLDSGDIH